MCYCTQNPKMVSNALKKITWCNQKIIRSLWNKNKWSEDLEEINTEDVACAPDEYII